MAGDGDGGTVVLTPWHETLPDEVKADPAYKPVFEKFKELPALIKGYRELEGRMGRSIALPGKDAKPEEIAGIKAKLTEAGLLLAPPASPAEYEIKKPEALPEGLGWSDELAGKFAGVLHKHGVPKAAASDLLTLYGEALAGAGPVIKATYEEGTTALKNEYGAEYEAKRESAVRLAGAIFTPEELALFESTGIGNHPKFLSVLMRLAPLAEQDSTFMAHAIRPGGEMTPEQVRTELADIMNNKDNPRNKGYWAQDKDVMKYVEELYLKAYGNKQVEIH